MLRHAFEAPSINKLAEKIVQGRRIPLLIDVDSMSFDRPPIYVGFSCSMRQSMGGGGGGGGGVIPAVDLHM